MTHIERYQIHFSKTSQDYEDFWDLDYSTLAEAREMAESFVDDNEADCATITNRDIYEEYCDGEWTIDTPDATCVFCRGDVPADAVYCERCGWKVEDDKDKAGA